MSVGCQSQPVAAFQSIKLGMTQVAVRETLGPPSGTIAAPAATPGDPTMMWSTRWQWGDTLSSSATAALFPDQPPSSRIGAVWFDGAGRVVEVQVPNPASPSGQLDRFSAPPR
jgi:hypothetical protein